MACCDSHSATAPVARLDNCEARAQKLAITVAEATTPQEHAAPFAASGSAASLLYFPPPGNPVLRI